MKILLINNYKESRQGEVYKALKLALAGHEVETQRYKPGLNFAEAGKDLIILSGGGGEGQEINDKYASNELWYGDQMKFIKATKKPVLGICMGFEVMARAYGAEVTEVGSYIKGFRTIKPTALGRQQLSSKVMRQYKAHGWRVQEAPKGFTVLAKSKSGVEVIAAKNRFAMQFHPEVAGGSLQLKQLINSRALA